MTVRELLGRIDSRELSEWMAFDRARPATAEEVRHADLMHLVASFTCGAKCPPHRAFLPKRPGIRAHEPEPIPFELQRAAIRGAFPTAPAPEAPAPAIGIV
ncbi:MAG: hypothetical protein INR70_08780 [Parafilimonas terrae]|nr:hypothetical protein [Parafilimonas terrae]